jgi:hypothetical protein
MGMIDSTGVSYFKNCKPATIQRAVKILYQNINADKKEALKRELGNLYAELNALTGATRVQPLFA